MKVLFGALHHAYYRNFDSVVRDLVARGHQVHLAAEEPESLGGRGLAERLAAESGGAVTWDLMPSLEHEPWFDAAQRCRVALDYVRVLAPDYPPKLRIRAWERTARVVRATSSVPVVGPRLARAALTQFERLLPVSRELVNYLSAHAPDVVVLTSLTYSRSQQLDVLRAARALEIPVVAAIMSWDHLSSKGLLHIAPDKVLVWNQVQMHEAITMHGLPGDRIVATGAQCYDQWFTKAPSRERGEFCRAMGLRADRAFALWVHSALSPTPDPPEPVLVTRWIEALRASANPALRELGVLVRPHPERLKEWAGIDLQRFENVAFHGGNPIDGRSRDDYFDSLYHSGAVVGLVTSAFLEAAIVGRPVLTFTLPEYEMHQEEMIHFRYLLTVAGGLLHTADNMDAHLTQLAAALARPGERDEKNRRFLEVFVRPQGLDVPATPAFVEALEEVSRAGRAAGSNAAGSTFFRPIAVGLAGWSRTGVGRWLMNDERADLWDEDTEARARAVRERDEHKARFHAAKVRRNEQQARRERIRGVWKSARSTARKLRHRAAVSVHRALHVTRLRRMN
jgi:hypothetical protein